tara:strand:+ start:382 stop:549 length:168 start_codon:yes stop_codon:yes gene_type:complete
MKHIWILEDGEWAFHTSFDAADCDDSTTVASVARCEIDDLRSSGIQAKFGPAPTS